MTALSRIPTMNKFFFVLDLRRGSMIVAVLGLLLCILDVSSVVYFIKYLTNKDSAYIHPSKN